MLTTRSPGVQASRMQLEQNRKELRTTLLLCNQSPAGHRAQYTPSPPRAAKPSAAGGHSPIPCPPMSRGLGSSTPSTTSNSPNALGSPSESARFSLPQIAPGLPSPSRNGVNASSVVSPSRRTFHMTPNDRRRFYEGFIDRPKHATLGVSQQWRQI